MPVKGPVRVLRRGGKDGPYISQYDFLGSDYWKKLPHENESEIIGWSVEPEDPKLIQRRILEAERDDLQQRLDEISKELSEMPLLAPKEDDLHYPNGFDESDFDVDPDMGAK